MICGSKCPKMSKTKRNLIRLTRLTKRIQKAGIAWYSHLAHAKRFSLKHLRLSICLSPIVHVLMEVWRVLQWLQQKLADSKWSIAQAQNHQLKVVGWVSKTHFERIRAVCWSKKGYWRTTEPSTSWSIPATQIEHIKFIDLDELPEKKTSGNFGRASPNLVIICHYHSDTWWHGAVQSLSATRRQNIADISRRNLCVLM